MKKNQKAAAEKAKKADVELPSRFVGYVMPDGQVRPAIVLRVMSAERKRLNLAVFLDGPNDSVSKSEFCGPSWRASVAYDEKRSPGTWHRLKD